MQYRMWRDTGLTTSLLRKREHRVKLSNDGSTPPGAGLNPGFSIEHKWIDTNRRLNLWFHDRFHVLLSLSFKSLVTFLVLAEAGWAAFLSLFLAVITKGNVQACLGGSPRITWIDYYFFTVETMFTVGFGTPRFPNCRAADIFTSVAVMLTNVFNGLLVGLVFSKFSSSTARKWALVFSPTLCGAVIKEFDSSASGGGGGSSSSSLAAEEPKHRRKKVISLKVIKSTILKRHYQNTYSSIGGFHRLTPSYLDYYSPRIQSSSNLETFLNLNTGYSISFRLMNVTQSLFFSPVLSIFLLEHGTQDLIISQISLYHTDVPLQFLELPITITVDNRDQSSPLNTISLQELLTNGSHYELLVLLTFIDNTSSRTIELRNSWRLDNIIWGHSFQGIVRRTKPGGMYEIDVGLLDKKTPLTDTLNADFVKSLDPNHSIFVRK